MKEEIKIGDKVRVSKDAPRTYIWGHYTIFEERESEVTAVGKMFAEISLGGLLPLIIAIPTKYLIKVDSEAEESSSAEKFFADRANRLKGQTKNFLDIDGLITPSFRTIPKIIFNSEFWYRYKADLAKEIVLKTVNCASDKRPSAVADYATAIAEAVVEGLKRK